MNQRLPEWAKRGIVDTEATRRVRKILKVKGLNTVCDSARCPNKNECYSKNTATFMILGNVCTRNCRFCSVTSACPEPLDPNEPKKVADAIAELGLDYAVITSVTRDDLKDGGAEAFAETIIETRKNCPDILIEVLTPDFKGKEDLIDIVIEARPDVFNHNIETVKRLYPEVRPQAIYERSLEFINHIKMKDSSITTKSGMMVGLGETEQEIIQIMQDLRTYNCDILTVGQYIQPTKAHLPVVKYVTPDEFKIIETKARELKFLQVVASPLARSSYNAKSCFDKTSQ